MFPSYILSLVFSGLSNKLPCPTCYSLVAWDSWLSTLTTNDLAVGSGVAHCTGAEEVPGKEVTRFFLGSRLVALTSPPESFQAGTQSTGKEKSALAALFF